MLQFWTLLIFISISNDKFDVNFLNFPPNYNFVLNKTINEPNNTDKSNISSETQKKSTPENKEIKESNITRLLKNIFNYLTLQCAFLFFSTAIVGAAATEFFNEKEHSSKGIEFVFFFLLPLTVFIPVIIIYLSNIFDKIMFNFIGYRIVVNQEILVVLSTVIFVTSILYLFLTKMLCLYLNNDILYNKTQKTNK